MIITWAARFSKGIRVLPHPTVKYGRNYYLIPDSFYMLPFGMASNLLILQLDP